VSIDPLKNSNQGIPGGK